MIIKSILTTTVTFEYDGDLNDINIQQYIENENLEKVPFYTKKSKAK